MGSVFRGLGGRRPPMVDEINPALPYKDPKPWKFGILLMGKCRICLINRMIPILHEG